MMSDARQAGACELCAGTILEDRFRVEERQRVERHLAELEAELTRLVPGQGSG